MIDITKEVTEALLDHGDDLGCDEPEELAHLLETLRAGTLGAALFMAEQIIAPHIYRDSGYGPHPQAESALLGFALRQVDWLRVRESLEALYGPV